LSISSYLWARQYKGFYAKQFDQKTYQIVWHKILCIVEPKDKKI